MALPNFIGIGAPRSGTTWLHELLQSHPAIHMPTRRKEVEFFDKNFEKGTQWYRNFFLSADRASQLSAVGEITPNYLYHPEAPKRIAELGSVDRLLLVLRNPTDRLFSEYQWSVRYGDYLGSFDEYISGHSAEAHLSRGHYSRYVERFLEYFDKSQLLTLIFENAIREPIRTQRQISDFLGLAIAGFPEGAGTTVVNSGGQPRFPWLFRFASNCRDLLQGYEQDWLINLGRDIGLKRMLIGKSRARSHITLEIREKLDRVYLPEIDRLEALLSLDLGAWKHQ